MASVIEARTKIGISLSKRTGELMRCRACRGKIHSRTTIQCGHCGCLYPGERGHAEFPKEYDHSNFDLEDANFGDKFKIRPASGGPSGKIGRAWIEITSNAKDPSSSTEQYKPENGKTPVPEPRSALGPSSGDRPSTADRTKKDPVRIGSVTPKTVGDIDRGRVLLSLKVEVANDLAKAVEVQIQIQGLDQEGFEIAAMRVNGRIAGESSETLTGSCRAIPSILRRVATWRVKTWRVRLARLGVQ
jgi:hypothetical protein